MSQAQDFPGPWTQPPIWAAGDEAGLIPGQAERLTRSQRGLLEILRAHALKRGSFTLSSGRLSSYLIDLRPLTLASNTGRVIGAVFGAFVIDAFRDAIAVGGLVLGAVPLAVCVAQGPAAIEAFLVRPEAKEHGTRRRVEASPNLVPGSPVVVIDDVATSGASLLEAAAAARGYGLRVVGVAVVVDREEGARERVESQLGVPFRALYRAAEVLAT